MLKRRKNLKFKIIKNRRKRKSAKNITENLRFLGVNAAGLRPKMMTFKKVIKELNPSVFSVQETKMKEEGKIKIENYVIFEKIRKKKENGGGIAIGCKESLNPVWVREGPEDVETLSIELFLKKFKIRFSTGYGFQENELIEKKKSFWEYYDNEVIEAEKSGSGLIIQMDGNFWAGKNIIPNDPRPQNNNGKLFQQFLERNKNLTVVNSLEICEGLITRKRSRDGKIEQSILDFFIVCDLVLPFLSKMVIDEDKKHILTNYENVKKGGKANDTDHSTEYIDLNLKISTEKPVRKEIWNFKNKKAQNKFKIQTSKTNDFTNCFNSELSLEKQIQNWRNILTKNIKDNFKKVRITKKIKGNVFDKKVNKFVNIRNKIMNDQVNRYHEIEEIKKEIAEMEAKMNRNKIVENFQSFSENPESLNLQQVWKLLNKLWPKVEPKLPSGKKNHRGILITESNQLKQLLAREYKERLRERPIRPDLENIIFRKNKIFEAKLKFASENKSKQWDMNDLEKALKDLKNNRSRDPEGLINEIFKKNVIGDDLKDSLLIMFNRLKQEQIVPHFMKVANITTVPKKGSQVLLENERGIFRVPVLRSIFMRLIYNQKYEEIDRKMSDSQMGGRKKKSCRNNILIVNGIIHDVLASKKNAPVILQIYDYKQMFDAISLQDAISDAFDTGVKDDNLTLIYRANREVKMSVNTRNGLTDRQTLKNVVLQGDIFGSILASIQVDKICKEVETMGHGYLYKNTLPITMLAMVDDMVGVTEVGFKAHKMNTAINIKTAEKRLQFNDKKCKTMFIGKTTNNSINNSLKVDKWQIEHKEEKGEINLVETFIGEVPIDETKEQKYLGFILSNTGDNMKNINDKKQKSVWIIRKIFNKLYSLKLRKYFFECALIFLNVMLRSSILYPSETYYNLKEGEIRALERIEENFLRQLLKTSKGCPISQLYLETGHRPARFEIVRRRLLFLKNILHEKPNSTLYKFIKLQFENPRRGDWMSSCLSDLEFLE